MHGPVAKPPEVLRTDAKRHSQAFLKPSKRYQRQLKQHPWNAELKAGSLTKGMRLIRDDDAKSLSQRPIFSPNENRYIRTTEQRFSRGKIYFRLLNFWNDKVAEGRSLSAYPTTTPRT